MASPFSLFRKHQKVLTVILTALAMFAFIVLDAVSRMDSARVMPFLFAAMGAGVFWIWGEGKEGKTDTTQILTGAILGAVIGALPLLTSSGGSGIPTSIGTISQQELMELRQKRELTNSFVRQAFNERENAFGFMLSRYLFGGTSTREIVARQLLLHEADRLGIQIGDTRVLAFINDVAEERLTQEEFRTIRGQLRVGEREMIDLIREELRAQAAYQVINPVVVHLPEQYWQDFRKVRVTQSVDVTAIPVEAFAEIVDGPSDAALQELFEQFKQLDPAGENPGFFQPPRRSLAWLQPDMKKIEAEVGDISDEDIAARYEERKDAVYKKASKLPELDLPEFGSEPEETDKPEGESDAPETESTAPALPETTPESETPTDEAPESPAEDPAPSSDEDTTAEPESESTTPSEEASETTSESDENDEAGDDGVFSVNDNQPPESEEQPAAKSQPEDTDVPATPAEAADEPESETTPEEAADSEPETPAAPASETPEEEKPEDEDGTEPESEATPETEEVEAVEYTPLEEVRDEIEDQLRNERVRELVNQRVDEVTGAGNKAGLFATLRVKFDEEVKAGFDEKGEEIEVGDTEAREERQQAIRDEVTSRLAEALGKWAADNNFLYRETEALSQQELVEHEEYSESVAVAREPFDPNAFRANQFQTPERKTVAQLLFENSYHLPIENVAESFVMNSDSTGGTMVKYVWWETGEVEAHLASFDEAGIRDQVEEAWRLREARPTAQERADSVAKLVTDELAKPADDEGNTRTMTEALTGETVSGKDDAVQLSVLSSGPFSWLRQSNPAMQQNMFFQQPQIEFGRIPGVDGADDEFMKTISEMEVGDVRSIPNVDRSVYYVVHLKSRFPDSDNELDVRNLQEQFISERAPVSPVYRQLAGSQSSEVGQQWMTEFFKRYNVDPDTLNSI